RREGLYSSHIVEGRGGGGARALGRGGRKTPPPAPRPGPSGGGHLFRPPAGAPPPRDRPPRGRGGAPPPRGLLAPPPATRAPGGRGCTPRTSWSGGGRATPALWPVSPTNRARQPAARPNAASITSSTADRCPRPGRSDHSGIGLRTPASVHFGTAGQIQALRAE